MGKKKPKNPRAPRTRAGNTWTEGEYWGFLRSNLRKMSVKWPPIVRLALLEARRDATPEDGYTKVTKFVYKCANCGVWRNRKNVQVDHIEPVGELSRPEHIGPFVEKLLCETDGLQVLCVDCNLEKKKREKADRNDAKRSLF